LNYRLSDTVFFNFGALDARDFGLACAVNYETPPDFSRAADYAYQSEGGGIYQFLERPRER
jgi:hypothetical protein